MTARPRFLGRLLTPYLGVLLSPQISLTFASLAGSHLTHFAQYLQISMLACATKVSHPVLVFKQQMRLGSSWKNAPRGDTVESRLYRDRYGSLIVQYFN